MALRIRKGTLPYTLAEIIDCDYPEQWSKAERPKLVAKPTFSFKRTLISIGLFLCVCLPLIARFIAVDTIQEMCFWLWGIVLIAFCLYLVWWLNDFVLVIRHRSDGSVEITEERESKKSSKL